MIAALAAATVLATSREQLVDRWLAANASHQRSSLVSASAPVTPPVDLRTLTIRELSVPGRYRLTEPPVPPPHRAWWAPIWDWVAREWAWLRDALFGHIHVHVSERSAKIVGDVLVLIAALVILFVLFQLLRNVRITRSKARARDAARESVADPDALYAGACAAAARGDYGLASLALFAAAIAALGRRGIVRSDRSATVGQLRRELRSGDEALVGPFDAVAAPFVQQAYAERAVTQSQWERALEAFAPLARDAQHI